MIDINKQEKLNEEMGFILGNLKAAPPGNQYVDIILHMQTSLEMLMERQIILNAEMTAIVKQTHKELYK